MSSAATGSIPDVARVAGFVGRGVLALPLVEADRVQVQTLDLRRRPVGFAKELQAAARAWFVVEALDVDPFAQPIPAVLCDQVFQNRLRRDAVQRAVRLRLVHNGASAFFGFCGSVAVNLDGKNSPIGDRRNALAFAKGDLCFAKAIR